MISFYRILTYLLLPFALFFSLLSLITFFVALANPALFLGVFMLAAFCIYYFCSFRFLHQGILQHRPLKPKLRDWIKVNAYVAMPFGVINFMQSFTVISKPTLIAEVVKQMTEMQQRMNMPVTPGASYEKMLLTLMYVMLVFALMLLIHLTLSFALLKKYQSLFEAPEAE